MGQINFKDDKNYSRDVISSENHLERENKSISLKVYPDFEIQFSQNPKYFVKI